MVSEQPMKQPNHKESPALRFLLASFWTILCILVVGAPVLASQKHYVLSSFIYLVYSGVCHQIPERSFFLAGFPLAVCHRCSGIYLGFIAGSLVKNPFIYRSPRARRSWIIVSMIPVFLDVSLPFAGIAESTPISRFLTGLLFGTMLSSIFLYGITELLHRAPFRGFNFKGGVQ